MLQDLGLDTAEYSDEHLRVAVAVAGTFGEDSVGAVGGLAYAAAMGEGKGARKAMRAGHRAAEAEREGTPT